jgi:hypothetical protein
MSETYNPFDTTGYVPENTVQPEPVVQAEPVVASEPVAAEPVVTTTTIAEPVAATPVSEPFSFEWKNDFSKNIYDKLVSKDVSELADILYEQKVLSSLETMDDADVIKLKMAYEFPELTPEEIEEEFDSKFRVNTEIDEDMLTDDEIQAERKKLDKAQKSINRELKKSVREARESLQELRKDIDFPDILSQMQSSQQPSEDAISQYLAKQQEGQQEQFQQARKVFESSIEDRLKAFDGFNVNYKDEDVQFDGKFNLTQEEKVGLNETLKSFDLESFYGNRYFKEGKYDTKQLAEDVYFLQNRDKVVNAIVTQAVSKAKSDMLKSMKNIDYSNQPRTSTAGTTNDYDEMVSAMFRM